MVLVVEVTKQAQAGSRARSGMRCLASLDPADSRHVEFVRQQHLRFLLTNRAMSCPHMLTRCLSSIKLWIEHAFEA